MLAHMLKLICDVQGTRARITVHCSVQGTCARMNSECTCVLNMLRGDVAFMRGHDCCSAKFFC